MHSKPIFHNTEDAHLSAMKDKNTCFDEYNQGIYFVWIWKKGYLNLVLKLLIQLLQTERSICILQGKKRRQEPVKSLWSIFSFSFFMSIPVKKTTGLAAHLLHGGSPDFIVQFVIS